MKKLQFAEKSEEKNPNKYDLQFGSFELTEMKMLRFNRIRFNMN